jgi:6-phosphogluconolactonase (cycloisomerase 2 family)
MLGRCSVKFVLACLASLIMAQAASAARTVYFSDPEADRISQYSVGADGDLSPLAPPWVDADHPRRLAMTPSGSDLYATSPDGVLQFKVAASGGLTPKMPALQPAPGSPHSIAVHPDGKSVYVTDSHYGKVRQYDVAGGGRLEPKDPPYVRAGSCAKGLALSPDGRTAYVLVRGGIVVFDVAADGALGSRGRVDVESRSLQDVALTPNGKNLYATSRDGRVLQFDVDASGDLDPKDVPEVETGAGTKPIGIAIVPDGSAAYVSTQAWGQGRQLFAFAIGAGGALAPGAPPSLPVTAARLWYLSASPDGRSLFLAGGDGHLFDIGPGAFLRPKASASVDLGHALGVVVSPNQAPVASFIVLSAPPVAGSPTRFDARGAADPDGSIVRYDWDFGDKTPVLRDGGPTPQHVYKTPGTYVARLVVTDNEGASTGTVFTGGTVLGAGGPGAEASRNVVVAAAAARAPGAPPPPGQPTQALEPDLGQSLLASPVRGQIRVRLPGADAFQPLQNLEELPIGSTIDARRGRVELTTVRDRRRTRLQDGVFYGGLFKVRQRRRDRYVTELLLKERLSCPRARSSTAVEARSSRSRRRRLWGRGRGRFRSRGRYSSATVRGTTWLVADRCGSTLTVVRRGRVAVRDFVRDRTVVLRRGDRYVARKPE